MNIPLTAPPQSTSILPITQKPVQAPAENQAKFSDVLKSSIEKLNNAQLSSDQKTEALAMGQVDDLHEVMIAAQKASITLETTVQLQKKVLDAYNEIMRMQV